MYVIRTLLDGWRRDGLGRGGETEVQLGDGKMEKYEHNRGIQQNTLKHRIASTLYFKMVTLFVSFAIQSCILKWSTMT